MITDSLEYLKESDDAWKTSILGGVFLLFSFLLLPLFFVWGYVVRVLDRTARGDDAVPAFDEWGDLTIDGAKAFVIVFAYSLVPALLGGVLVGGVLLATGGSPGAFGAVALVVAGLLTAAVGLAVAYVAPAALANYAAERHIGAGVDLEALAPTLKTGTYASGWLLAVGLVVVGSFVASLLAIIPFVGAVLGGIVTFYALVSAAYVVGHTWGDLHPIAVDGDAGSDEPSTERPAI